MTLTKEDIEEIRSLLIEVISERPDMANNNVRYELEIRERIVRVEEELKHQRELMIEGFNQMEKRFDQVDKRFEILTVCTIDRFMVWAFTIMLAVGGVIVAVIIYIP